MKDKTPLDRAFALDERGHQRRAFKVFLAAARRGDANAFLTLGYAYETGRGTRPSKRKAVRWYKRALAAGDVSAAHNIGTVFRDRGNHVRAARWFMRAIAMGHSGSNLELGQLLLRGNGQPTEALAAFRAVGGDESEATIEAARSWAVVVEGMLASSTERNGKRGAA